MTKEEIKALCDRYPWLVPRNVWTDKLADDYDYSYAIGIGGDIPRGWQRLFLQMCEDIRQPLIDAEAFDKFRIGQLKEKYNTLRCYCTAVNNEVNDIIFNYEYVSQFICQGCGKPATVETEGWIVSYCDECYARGGYTQGYSTHPIKFEPICTVRQFGKDGEKIIKRDYSDIWRRLWENKEVNNDSI